MKIALFTETYSPYINGVVTHINILKSGLEALGHQVLVITADTDTRRHYVKEGVLHCPAKKLKKIYGYGLASPISYKRLKLLREFAPDVIHIHQEFGVGLFGVIAAKFLKVPLVYTLHTMYDDYVYYVAPKGLLKVTTKLLHRYEKTLGNKADVLVGPSQKVAEFFKLCGVKKPVQLVPNTVELDKFGMDVISEDEKKALREKLGVPENATIGCFVGRLGKEKSIDTLLKFFAETYKKEDNIFLVIIGSGPDEDELKALCESLGLNERVIFAGKVPHEEIPPYYAISDFFVSASLTEMHSISMLEALASGLTVVQRYDEANASQLEVGVNGEIFKDAKEMYSYFKGIASLSAEEKSAKKDTVRKTVENSGAVELATYLLGLYDIKKKISEEKQGNK